MNLLASLSETSGDEVYIFRKKLTCQLMINWWFGMPRIPEKQGLLPRGFP